MHGANGESAGSKMATMFCFGDSAWLPDAVRNGIAEVNLHRFDCEMKPGVFWRVRVDEDSVLVFDWLPEYRGYAMKITDNLKRKLDSLSSS